MYWTYSNIEKYTASSPRMIIIYFNNIIYVNLDLIDVSIDNGMIISSKNKFIDILRIK